MLIGATSSVVIGAFRWTSKSAASSAEENRGSFPTPREHVLAADSAAESEPLTRARRRRYRPPTSTVNATAAMNTTSRSATMIATAPSSRRRPIIPSHLAAELSLDVRREVDIRQQGDPHGDAGATVQVLGVELHGDVAADVVRGAHGAALRIRVDRDGVLERARDGPRGSVHGLLADLAHRSSDGPGPPAFADRRLDRLDLEEREPEPDDAEDEHEQQRRDQRHLDGRRAVFPPEAPSSHG